MPRSPGYACSNEGSKSPFAGDWLARLGGDGDLDLSSLGEVEELGLNTQICGNVLADLRRDPPPRHDEAQAQVAAAVARWNSPARGDGARSAGSVVAGARSRSSSRAPAPETSCSAAARPPRPLNNKPLAPVAAARPVAGLRRPSRADTVNQAAGSAISSGYSVPSRQPLSPLHVNSPPPQQRGRSDDDSLLGSMAARLAQVEQLNKHQTTKLAEQEQEIVALRQELEEARCSASTPSAGCPRDNSGSCAHCAKLKQQIDDMTKFLASYGLTWVAASNLDENDPQVIEGDDTHQENDPLARKYGRPASAPNGVAVDIDVLKARAESLNAMLEQDAPKVCASRAGGAFNACLVANAPLPVPISFFRDGIKLSDHAFRRYDLPSAQSIIKDVLDGYFPNVLADEHPDGVPLKVIDRTGNMFRPWLKNLARNDPDLTNGGDSLRPKCGGQPMKTPGDDQSPLERFVAKLPERVVRAGQLCPVRSNIAAQWGVGSGSAAARCASEPPGSSSQYSGNEVSLLEGGRAEGAPVARLQVKLEGGQNLVICMEPHATIGGLLDALATWRSKHKIPKAGVDGRQCCLRSAFPPCTYTDHEQTLEAAGLMPSAKLFVSIDPRNV